MSQSQPDDEELAQWQTRWAELDQLPYEEQIAALESAEAQLRAQLEAGRQSWDG